MNIKILTTSYVDKISKICIDSFLEGEYNYYLQKANLDGLDNFIDFCSVDNIRHKMQDPSYVFIGVMHENTLVAISCINIGSDKIPLFFVAPEYMGKGYGSFLLNKLTDYAKQQNLKVLHVDSTHFAVPFYQKHNFITVGTEIIIKGSIITTPMKKKI